ncbi:hypothetical protein [Cylindrospermopsis raciborskii]|uniref:hypothetical protein n=1 Tax=Cylindrospermopsis raciborskii TaxID=77022 RepID=UPI0022BF4927|nr:hypothetical protein [Cylindrospermopsis raciborskii]MCZ2203113.1 hypothetical protein [Cylindrospermopsis raciborskii PAMP2012]MCZ2207192.1 hypothetical protein [Cylindrospermopsis raciborskii PAMP2011]
MIRNTSKLDQNTSRISPEKAISDYYTKINNKQYDTAWDIYPTVVKEDKKLHPNGYDSFIQWWEKVDNVSVNRVNLQSENNDSATVNFIGDYNMKNGKSFTLELQFYLSWNSQNSTWYVTKVNKIRQNTNWS